ncbi:MAG: hypothetical protein ACRDHM_01255 [Actinomycetota bacterium]
MADPTVRFGAGTPDRPRSAVWRLWVHGSDAYLGARVLLGSIKLSIHESGQWISAFTEQSGAVIKETGSRRHETWTRPAEFHPGWTQGPVVGIPWVSWRDDLKPRDEIPAKTLWVPAPKRYKKLLFSTLISAPDVPKDAVIPALETRDRVLASLPMANGETMWLVAQHRAMSPDESTGIRSAEREFRGIGISGSLRSVHAWGLWIATSNLGGPILVQFPLGRRHFNIEPGSG